MKLTRLLCFVAMLVVAEPAIALRCGNKLVSEGDPKTKILKYCGDPAAVQYRTIYRSGFPRALSLRDTRLSARHSGDDELLIHQHSVVEVQVEEWTYNFGPRRFMRMIRFENGLVAKVTDLGYGYHE